MELSIEKILYLTPANLTAQILGRTIRIPLSQIKGVEGNKLHFHNKKDAQAILRMV